MDLLVNSQKIHFILSKYCNFRNNTVYFVYSKVTGSLLQAQTSFQPQLWSTAWHLHNSPSSRYSQCEKGRWIYSKPARKSDISSGKKLDTWRVFHESRKCISITKLKEKKAQPNLDWPIIKLYMAALLRMLLWHQWRFLTKPGEISSTLCWYFSTDFPCCLMLLSYCCWKNLH